MEQDNEVKGNGNHYTTYFRQYDPRLGRWFSVDPKTRASLWESPYISMGGNPILYNDPLGDIVEHKSFRDRVNTTVARLFNKDFRKDYRQLKNSDETYVFWGLEYDETRSKRGEFTYEGGDKLLVKYDFGFDPSSGVGGIAKLRHETKHGVQFDDGKFGFINMGKGWSIFNGDLYEEYEAHNAQFSGFGKSVYKDWNSRIDKRKFGYTITETDYSKWGSSDFNERINFLKENNYDDPTGVQLVNGNSKRIKNNAWFMRPYNSNSNNINPSIPIMKIKPYTTELDYPKFE